MKLRTITKFTLADIPKDCPLHRKTPYGIQGVSSGMFSVARHYGGIQYKGDHYIYLQHSDELIRDDVYRFVRKHQQQARKDARKTMNQQQQELKITIS
jgi:hypothetical protein